MSSTILTDPFEQAFFDYLHGQTGATVTVHNNKGDDEVMPVAYFFRRYEEMPPLEQLALDLCQGHILDIGAGSGCHALYLQEKGLQVTALDIRPGFVEVMRRRGVRDVIRQDIRKLKKGNYDTLLMLMNGIGFTSTLIGLEKFLLEAGRLLNPGGQILLDSSDLIYLYQDDEGNVELNLNDNYYGEVEYQVEYQGMKGVPFHWLFVDFTNLSFLADQAGLRSELLFEDDHFNYLARLY
jgi:SAM-dependent methyltransferase